jgi:hypothetical protein
MLGLPIFAEITVAELELRNSSKKGAWYFCVVRGIRCYA